MIRERESEREKERERERRRSGDIGEGVSIKRFITRYWHGYRITFCCILKYIYVCVVEKVYITTFPIPILVGTSLLLFVKIKVIERE